MAQFLLTYIGTPRPETPEQQQQHLAKYREWLSNLGDAAVSPANPIKNTQTVNSDGGVSDGGRSEMSGYTIVEAASHDDALEMAKACPFLEVGGSLEVSELIKMGG